MSKFTDRVDPRGDTTPAHAPCVPLELDVALVPPVSAPAVLDDPVVQARVLVNPPASDQDSVVCIHCCFVTFALIGFKDSVTIVPKVILRVNIQTSRYRTLDKDIINSMKI